MNDQVTTKSVKFYWDIGSTNSYFAFHLLRRLVVRYDAAIEYVPFSLGYVFRHHNYALTDETRAKMKNRKVDLMRWARRHELNFRIPDQFPIKTSRVLRGALVMREWGLEEAYMEEVFRRYWEENDASIATYVGLAHSVEKLGCDASEFQAQAESATVQQRFIELTQQALAEEIFGAPTMVVDGEIYWGKDRFEFIEDHLKSA